MAKKMKPSEVRRRWTPERGEAAMIEGILEGSPDAVGVAVIRLDCGCRKMAAVDGKGEPASKIIMYRDRAESVCEQCKKDDGHFSRVSEQFIHWSDKGLSERQRHEISVKVLGSGYDQVH